MFGNGECSCFFHSSVHCSKKDTFEGKFLPVVSMATGMYGQLGLGNSEKQSCPVVVPGLQKRTVYLIGCGNFHTVRALHG